MSILENNFNQAIEGIARLVNKEKQEGTTAAENVVVQVAYNEESFELYSAALNVSKEKEIPDVLGKDPYYNIVFMADGLADVLPRFKDKYLFKLAYADVSYALHCAYKRALMSENGECVFNTSFYKPHIEDASWAYREVFRYTPLGHFRCWFNFDDEFKEVNIQVDNDLMLQYQMDKTSIQ